MRIASLAGTIAALILGSTISAHATVLTVFDSVADGSADFDATVTGAGATVTVDTWTGLTGGTSDDRGDYTITNNDGGTLSPTGYGSLSGEVYDISPSGGGSLPRTDPLDYYGSGITLTFDTAVNSVGFEVGDWATCCYDPTTDLYMSFDGGAPILVASADDFSDGALGPNGEFEIFVAAFDDSGSFTEVSFWGNGIGEFLVFGGEVRYALVDEGSLPGVPLPASGWLMIAGLGGIAALRRRRRV